MKECEIIITLLLILLIIVGIILLDYKIKFGKLCEKMCKIVLGGGYNGSFSTGGDCICYKTEIIRTK